MRTSFLGEVIANIKFLHTDTFDCELDLALNCSKLGVFFSCIVISKAHCNRVLFSSFLPHLILIL